MARLNISLPEALNRRLPLNRRFLSTFSDRDRSALIAGLIEDAIREHERRRRGDAAIERMLARRSRTRPTCTAEIRRILTESRRARTC